MPYGYVNSIYTIAVAAQHYGLIYCSLVYVESRPSKATHHLAAKS
jgi:hypothetical protein